MTDMHTAADEAAKVWMEKCRGREAEVDNLTEVLDAVLLRAFTCSDPEEFVLHCQEVFGQRNEGKPMSMEWFE